MDHLAKLVAALALAYASTAHAGYAELRPPTGWTAGTATNPATYAKAANEVWTTNTVRTTASLNVGGRAITVPASMRLSANSGQYITGRIGAGLLGGPAGFALTVGLLALPSVIDWYTQQDTYSWNTTSHTWQKKVDALQFMWVASDPQKGYDSPAAACKTMYIEGTITAVLQPGGQSAQCRIKLAGVSAFDGAMVYRREVMGSRLEPAPWPQPQPDLSALPIGDPFLNEPALPFPLPVNQPVINPSPAGQPQPLFVPTGNPVPNPNYNPSQAPSPTNQPYMHPGVRVVPAPTPSNPWQVDVQPVDKPVPNPDASPEPSTENPTDPKPENKEGDLCEKNPDILACQKVDLKDLEPTPVVNTDKTLAINPDTGWGPSGGTCPPPRTASVMGVSISMPFTMLCDFASAIKPLFIAMAWLSAAMAFLGLGRKD